MEKAPSAKEIVDRALDESTLGKNQVRTWLLASLGIAISGYDLFVMSVAIPLIQAYFHIFSPMMAGVFAGAAFLGAVPGALISGLLSDRLGRRFILLINMLLLTLTSLLCAVAWTPWTLILFRGLQGLAIGAEYPLSASLIAEIMPRSNRGKWMTGAFSFQSIGMTIAAIVATLILFLDPVENAWRWMLFSCAIPSLVVACLRRKLKESPRWLIRKKRCEEARRSLHFLLGKETPLSCDRAHLERAGDLEPPMQAGCLSELFHANFRTRTLLTTIPWFLMDISLYGIGLFTPMILLDLMHKNILSANGFLGADFAADAITAIADIFLIIGFLLNISMVDRYGRIKLQVLGFLGMAIGMAIIGVFGIRSSNLWLMIGFSLFNLMVNLGPNATTYLLPVEVFPTRLRATGHGFSAAAGKIGACVGVFFLPTAAHVFGLASTLTVIGILSVLGAIITLLCRVETRGMPLE